MTLLELLIALSVMVMIVGALGGLARAVQSAAAYSEGCAEATQHARVALERITRTVDEAFANERFPGFIVVAEQEGRWRFPDTLVVWHPDPAVLAAHPSRPALEEPDRLPYHDELVVYCPDPLQPGRLVEIRSARDVPLGDSPSGWPAEIQVFKDSMSRDAEIVSGASSGPRDYPAVTLTERMRTSRTSDSGLARLRGAVRFESLLRPSNEQWNNSSIAWESLPWLQGMSGKKTGMRQAWLRVELQLMSAGAAGQNSPGGQQATAFFGSAAVYYPMHRDRRP